ncbi:MAG: 3-oxoacyl-[acyl-carrier-protein] synthase III C-terminal domain-containing protein [Betaproteobacteria bacterium]|jgi:3-oxoacyl-[acyl-carrier-protein] synthase-3|nr:hypothetical protein [Rubrivivax sp.]
MSTRSRPGITGRGHALPATIRTNDDPVFDVLKTSAPKEWQAMFNGYDRRHVLAPGERIDTYMAQAAQAALAQAGLAAGDVELLLGYASVSDYAMPNALAHVHQLLGLSERCWVLPVNVEYSNFNASLLFADALLRAGRAGNALVVCGGNWSRFVDYHEGPAASAADGAGAAVMQMTDDDATFRVVDHETVTATQITIPPSVDPGIAPGPVATYGHMMMGADVVDPGRFQPPPGGRWTGTATYTQPYFHLDAVAQDEFKTFGLSGPVKAAQRLLARQGLQASQVTVICHQTSRVLLDAWARELAPHALIETLSTFANMTLASIPVNLSSQYERIETDWLLLLGIGPELHANALLLRRRG